jgi:hypothetical protein
LTGLTSSEGQSTFIDYKTGTEKNAFSKMEDLLILH